MHWTDGYSLNYIWYVYDQILDLVLKTLTPAFDTQATVHENLQNIAPIAIYGSGNQFLGQKIFNSSNFKWWGFRNRFFKHPVGLTASRLNWCTMGAFVWRAIELGRCSCGFHIITLLTGKKIVSGLFFNSIYSTGALKEPTSLSGIKMSGFLLCHLWMIFSLTWFIYRCLSASLDVRQCKCKCL